MGRDVGRPAPERGLLVLELGDLLLVRAGLAVLPIRFVRRRALAALRLLQFVSVARDSTSARLFFCARYFASGGGSTSFSLSRSTSFSWARCSGFGCGVGGGSTASAARAS